MQDEKKAFEEYRVVNLFFLERVRDSQFFSLERVRDSQFGSLQWMIDWRRHDLLVRAGFP